MIGIVWFILRQLSNKRAWVEAQGRNGSDVSQSDASRSDVSQSKPADADAADAHEGLLRGRFHRLAPHSRVVNRYSTWRC